MSSLAAAVRPARRDAARHPWRILAAILLIMLPVAVLSYGRAWNDSRASALQPPMSGTTVSADLASCLYSDPSLDPSDCPSTAEVEAALPEGFEALHFLQLTGTIRGPDFIDSVGFTQVPPEALPADFAPSTGSLPGAGEIMLPYGVYSRHDLEIGDRVTVGTGATTVDLTVSGFTPADSGLVTGTTFQLSDDPSDPFPGMETWQITGPREFTVADSEVFQQAGFLVHSQDLPGRTIRGPLDQERPSVSMRAAALITQLARQLIALTVLVLVMVPVFTIAVSRQTRNYALMRSQGAAPRHIWWAVLAYGALAGALGATLGVIVGVGSAFVSWQVRFAGWTFSVPWRSVALMWLFTVAVCVLASALPARRATRLAVTAGVSGASVDRVTGWRRWMAVGPVVLTVLTVGWLIARVVLFVQGRGNVIVSTPLTAVPFLVALLVLAASVPALVLGLSRLTDRAGLVWRLAGRDARRRALTSVPAITAIVVVVFAASVGTVSLRVYEERLRSEAAAMHPDTLAVLAPSQLEFGGAAGGTLTEGEFDQLADSLASVVPVTGRVPLSAVVFPEETATDGQSQTSVQFADQKDCFGTYEAPLTDVGYERLLNDPELASLCLPVTRITRAASPLFFTGTALEATPEVLYLYTWENDADHAAAVVVERYTGGMFGPPATSVVFRADVPVAPVLPSVYNGPPLMTPALIDEHALDTEVTSMAVLTGRRVTQLQKREIEQVIGARQPGYQAYFTVDGFFVPRSAYLTTAGILGAGSLFILSLVIALAAVEDRRRYDQMAAVGAPPGLPRKMAALSAGMLALLGGGVGLVASHVAALAGANAPTYNVNGDLVDAGTLTHVRVDWLLVVVLLVIVPALVAGFAALVHLLSGRPEGVARRDD